MTLEVAKLVVRAWRWIDSEPDAALTSARKAAETICQQLFRDTISATHGVMSLEDMIQKLSRAGSLPQWLVLPLRTVQTYGNYGTHSQTDPAPIDSATVRTCLSALDEIVSWYYTSYLKQALPAELRNIETTAVSRPTPTPAKRAASEPLQLKARPIQLLALRRGLVMGTDLGEWCTIGPTGELTALAPTGAFAAAVSDGTSVTVASWEASVKQLRADGWLEVMMVAPPLALAVTDRGVIAGGADGGLTLVPAGSRIPVQDIAAPAPILELLAMGTSLAVIDAAGGVSTTTWPWLGDPTLTSIDTARLGRPYALRAGPQPNTAIVVGERGIGVLRHQALDAVVEHPEVNTVVAFRGHERACVITDFGAAWIVDAALQRTARIRIAESEIIDAVALPDGSLLAWTADGDLHAITSDGGAQRLTQGDVVLAAADPETDHGYVAVHWTAASGARVSRGRATWS